MDRLCVGHRIQGRWIFAPVSDITTPKPGRLCYGPHWWAVTENGEVLFFDNYTSPQCNSNKAIVERLGKGFDAPPTTPQFIALAFVPHKCSDYL
jgi:hypothetical protein